MASTMNQKRNRGGRMNTGRQDKQRQYYSDRQQRSRGPSVDKTLIDGVFKNQRYTHVVCSLIGSKVQVQVKNGIIYEGILKTYSSKGDLVLELAHMVEDNSNGRSQPANAPSRDSLIEKLIVKPSDQVTINAVGVDLDYAIRDTFTDTGISKHNGENKEKTEMKELQPWDADGSVHHDLETFTGDRSNGWDPQEMFRTNAQQFNVKSSYDESLSQYTTKLEKSNTDEYKRREEEAKKLAAEIEGSEQYKQHIALENGEGEGDEESRFSSVVRPDDSGQAPGPAGNPGNTPAKYVPPNMRSGGGSQGGGSQGGGRQPPRSGGGYPPHHQQSQPPPRLRHNTPPSSQQPSLGHHAPHPQPPQQPATQHQQQHAPPPSSVHQQQSHAPPHHHQPPSHHQQPPSQHQPHPHQSPHQQHSQQQHQQHHHHHQQQQSSVPVASPQSAEISNVNRDEPARQSVPASTAGPTVKTSVSSPVIEQPSPVTSPDGKSDSQHIPTSPGATKGERKRGRNAKIQELKDFSSNFKLDDKEKEKDPNSPVVEGKDNVASSSSSVSADGDSVSSPEKAPSLATPTMSHVVSPETHNTEEDVHAEHAASETTDSGNPKDNPNDGESQQDQGQAKQVESTVLLNSTLNPNAKAFNPGKPFQPKHSTQQIPTPPRPQTQSPIIQQAMMNIPTAQPVYPSPGQQFIMPPAVMLNSAPQAAAQTQQMPYNVGVRQTKRAVVSVKPDFTAAAQAATGQPLLAQPTIFMQQPQMVAPQPTGYQMGQVMPMPSTNISGGQRFMTPTSMPAAIQPTSHPGAVENNSQTHTAPAPAGQVYMANPPQPGGPMPAHMSHSQAPHLHTHIPAHHPINNHSNQPTNQMNPPPHSAPHHPPAPSPVHTAAHPGHQAPAHQGHPPSSGTPQPPQGAYPQVTLQQTHPPLQPSPHNTPTSPQGMQAVPYPYTGTSYAPHLQMANASQYSGQQSNVPTSVTYSMQTHGHHSPHIPQHQIVMMPPQHGAGGQFPHPHIHGSHQFPMAAQMQMHQQAQMLSQSGMQGLAAATNHTQGGHPQPPQMQHFIPQVHNQAGHQQAPNYQTQ